MHALAHAINETLGDAGNTVTYSAPVAGGPADQGASFAQLVKDMEADKVSTLVIVEGNPVFTAPADLGFVKALGKVELRIHLGLYDDETSRLCHWHVAQAHPLEAWSDARAYDGTVTILQPLIAPLFGGKSAHELLAAFSDQPEKPGHDIVKEYWNGKLPGPDPEQAWRKALHDGLVDGSAAPAKPMKVRSFPLSPAAAPASSQLTLLFRPDPTIWDGSYANNGWMQELAKPLTKLTWENAALIAPATAQKLGLTTEDVVTLTLDGRKVEAPVWVMPGQAEGCVTVHLGYGRTRGGRVADGKGFDAYALRASTAPWAAAGLEIGKTLKRTSLATTQHQYGMEGRDPVRAVTAEAYRKDPSVVAKMGEPPPGPKDTLYPTLPTGSYAWGLSIDLSTCVGCNACVDRLPVGEQHPGRRQGRGRARAGAAVDPHRPLLRGRARQPRDRPPARDLHALRGRAVRNGLPRRGHGPQRRRPEPDDLQPLRRHAVLLEQLSVQGAALQLLPLHRLHDRDPEAPAQPRRHRPQPRRHGEVQLLRPAHQPGPLSPPRRKTARSGTARS